VAPAVAKAAIDSGVARITITNWSKYREDLRKRLGLSNPIIRQMKTRSKHNPKRVVFAEAENYKMLKAAEITINEKLAIPILLGNKKVIQNLIQENELELGNVEIIDPKAKSEKVRRREFANIYWKKRQRKGVTLTSALDSMLHRNFFSPMLVEVGYADAMISGLTRNYPDTLRPALEIIGKREGEKIVSGMYIISTKKGPFFLADCTVNKNPTIEEMVEITLQTAYAIKQFKVEPRVAFVSYSNFGSNNGRIPEMQRKAVEILHREHPELIVEGEMQANVALDADILSEIFPFSKLSGKTANTLIFPYLTAANIAYKLLQSVTDNRIIGPIINGMNKSVHVLQIGSSVNEIVDMVMIAVMDAQCVEKRDKGDNCI
jgi:malate dehydrogenase (oxaloacetate-decarboxylating)(NADP+)